MLLLDFTYIHANTAVCVQAPPTLAYLSHVHIMRKYQGSAKVAILVNDFVDQHHCTWEKEVVL